MLGGTIRWEISVLCAPFCCDPKTALANTFYSEEMEEEEEEGWWKQRKK